MKIDARNRPHPSNLNRATRRKIVFRSKQFTTKDEIDWLGRVDLWLDLQGHSRRWLLTPAR